MDQNREDTLVEVISIIYKELYMPSVYCSRPDCHVRKQYEGVS